MKLSIIIPAYNEEKRILKPLTLYYEFFNKKLGKELEIIVVPNNCKDNTIGVVRDFSKDKKNIVIKNIEKINGKGLAVMEGFKIAKGDIIGFVDVDESTSVEEFNKLYDHINGFDGIIASRRIRGAKITPRRSAYKNLSGIAFNLVVRFLFSLPYKDTQCGAKLFKKELAHFLAKNVHETKYAFDVELLYLCKKNNKKILEYPIHWKEAGGGYVTTSAGIQAVWRVIKLRFK
jgi:glycosyltransferase involved in cell wall biosynthesis